jgi:hypothetical protein
MPARGITGAVAIDADGETLFSTKVINDEAQILTLVETARERADEVRWAVDISGRASALLLALLIAHGQQVVYVAVEATQSQMVALPGEKRAAKLVCDLAHQLLALDERIKDND